MLAARTTYGVVDTVGPESRQTAAPGSQRLAGCDLFQVRTCGDCWHAMPNAAADAGFVGQGSRPVARKPKYANQNMRTDRQRTSKFVAEVTSSANRFDSIAIFSV